MFPLRWIHFTGSHWTVILVDTVVVVITMGGPVGTADNSVETDFQNIPASRVFTVTLTLSLVSAAFGLDTVTVML